MKSNKLFNILNHHVITHSIYIYYCIQLTEATLEISMTYDRIPTVVSLVQQQGAIRLTYPQKLLAFNAEVIQIKRSLGVKSKASAQASLLYIQCQSPALNQKERELVTSPELEKLYKVYPKMILFTIALHFFYFSMVQAMPSLLETKARVGLPGTNMGLKSSSNLFGKRHSLDTKYPQYMMQLYQSLSQNDTDLFNLQRPDVPDYDSVLSLVAKSEYHDFLLVFLFY